jgi:hypothetical protein
MHHVSTDAPLSGLRRPPAFSFERVKVEVPAVPRPTFAVGYDGQMLEEGDEIELNEQNGRRLVEAGVLEEAAKSKRGARKK